MSARVIAVFNHKGGVGKTLITMLLAGEFASRGNKVTVIDMDSQADSLAWLANAPEDNPFPAKVLSLAALKDKFVQSLPQHAADADLILIDCPPSDASSVPYSALVVSDLALIPVQPTPQERDSVVRALTLVREAETRNPSLKHAFVINRLKPQSAIAQVSLSVLEELAGEKPLPSMLGDRVAYQEVMHLGGTIRTIGGGNPKAVEEVKNLANEVIKLFK